MKDRPLMPEQYRVTTLSELAFETHSMKVSGKMNSLPGQFVIVSLSGVGECPLYIASHKGSNLEFVYRTDCSITKAMSRLSKGDRIGIRGPYGKGLPVKEMNKKDIYLIGQDMGIAPLKHLVEHLKKAKVARTISIYASFMKKDYIIASWIKEWEKDNPVILSVGSADKGYLGRVGKPEDMLEGIRKDNSLAIVSVRDASAIAERLLALGLKEKQIYAAAHRTIVCGIGKCGHCLHNGRYICKEGPFMRYDIYKEMIRR